MENVNVVYSLIYNKEDNTILMVQNENSIWTLPGGAVEHNETLQQAAVREALEETGLEVEVGNIVAVNEAFFPERGHHALMITFAAKIIGGNIGIHNKEEILDIKWVDLETANQLMPYHKMGVQRLLESSVPYTFQG
jgi:8-oxo-dGTP diphosphatase